MFKICFYDKQLNKYFKNSKIKIKIFSVHYDYINLITQDNIIITIIKEHLQNLPFSSHSIVLDKKSLTEDFDFRDKIILNDKICFNKTKIIFFKSNIIFDLHGSKAQKLPQIKIKNCNINRQLLNYFLKCLILRKKMITRNTLVLSIKFFNNLNIDSYIETMIKKFIGLGTGSTPEFDDFICGVLTSFYIFDKTKSLSEKGRSKFMLIKKTLIKHKEKTTLLSQNFITQVCNSKYPLLIVRFVESLFNNNICKSEKIFNLILNKGNNSGWWFLYGFLKTMKLKKV